MKRRIFNEIAVLSAVLCVGALYFRVRSYSHWDSVDWSRGWTAWQVRSDDGTLAIQFNRHAPEDSKPYYYFETSSCPPFEPYDWSKSQDAIGVVTWEMMWRDRYWWMPEEVFACRDVSFSRSANSSRFPVQQGCWALDVRYRALAICTAILPVLASTRLLWTLYRRKPGHCSQCGYDLRATPDRCPECGTVPTKLEAKAS